jgi:hypothetical protein
MGVRGLKEKQWIARHFESPNRGEILQPGSQWSAGPGRGITLEGSPSPNRGETMRCGPAFRQSDPHAKRITALQASSGLRGSLKPGPALRSDPGCRIPPALGLSRPRLPIALNPPDAERGTVSKRIRGNQTGSVQ